MWRFRISLLVPLALAACTSSSNEHPQVQAGLHPSSLPVVSGLPPPTQCALFAREFTGIRIHADAWAWWDQAARADYPRKDTPHPNTIIVLRSTHQLPLGHVGIVKRIVGPREITITHANWGMDDPTKRIVHDSTAVVDVSPKNDWTQVRFWNAPAHAFGKVYLAYGFIYPHGFSENGEAVW